MAIIFKAEKTIAIRAALVFVLWDFVKPAQLWLCGLVRRSDTTVRSKTETVSGDRNRLQGSVGVCFVGFREARATLALWLG